VRAHCDDGALTPDNGLIRWGLAMDEAISKSGRVRPSEAQMKTRLEQAGFVDVQSFAVKQPIGPWAKDKYASPGPGSSLNSFGQTNILTSIGVSKSWASCLFWRASKVSIHTVRTLANARQNVVAHC
jgi:hypothetical protein